MFGWSNGDEDTGGYAPPPPPNNRTSEETPPPPPNRYGDNGTVFREWNRANARYEELAASDPLASPGNGSLSGWSINAGNVDNYPSNFVYDDDDEIMSCRSNDSSRRDCSSPREAEVTKHGLSMIREEDTGSKSPGAHNFDEVDLETARKSSSSIAQSGSHGREGGDSNQLDLRSSSSTSSPLLQFRIVAGVAALLVFACLLGVIVMASSKKPTPALVPIQIGNGNSNALSASGSNSLEIDIALTDEPTIQPSTTPSSDPTPSPSSSPEEAPVSLPTFIPTATPSTSYPSVSTSIPTVIATPESTPMPTVIVTNNPTEEPTFFPTSEMPTYAPSEPPMTFSPTMDCTDEMGEFETYNGKLRNCEWLDNDFNGQKSARKDMNCEDSELGEACRYTCRLYNGCMDYLLSALPEYTADNDVSIGNMCRDNSGEFISNGDTPRICEWIEEDPQTAPIKKNLNCGTPDVPKTELGIMCGASCAGYNDCVRLSDGSVVKKDFEMSPPVPGMEITFDDDGESPTLSPTLWGTYIPTQMPVNSYCVDSEGEYETHSGTLRKCRWLRIDGDDISADEKTELNCGITEIGLACMETCPCDETEMAEKALMGSLVAKGDDADADGPPPVFDEETMGALDSTGNFLTLVPTSDATISELEDEVSFGGSKRLHVGFEEGKALQTLMTFDLSYLTYEYKVIGDAIIRMYAVGGSDKGGVVVKMMDYTAWSEDTVTWKNAPGKRDDEPIVSFLDNVHSDSWYDLDVTSAIQDALQNRKRRVSIRIVSEDDDAEIIFSSKERDMAKPKLIVDLRTKAPTLKPTSEAPTQSPTVHLDCMDRKGKFRTTAGERQPCSWLDVGNGSLKKEMNCQDQKNDAALFCQATCSAYNGCDSLHCEDKSGMYRTHTGWTAECSWLQSGQGDLKLEHNCGTDDFSQTELGRRCQHSCREFNGCNKATRK